MYTIDFDIHTRTLRIVPEGFWSITTVTAFMTELIARATAIRLRHGRFLTLVDMRKGAVHSAAVVTILEAMTPKALRISSDPVAAVVPSVLNRMQTARYLKGDNCRLFPDMAEAQAWLSSAGLGAARLADVA